MYQSLYKNVTKLDKIKSRGMEYPVQCLASTNTTCLDLSSLIKDNSTFIRRCKVYPNTTYI